MPPEEQQEETPALELPDVDVTPTRRVLSSTPSRRAMPWTLRRFTTGWSSPRWRLPPPARERHGQRRHGDYRHLGRVYHHQRPCGADTKSVLVTVTTYDGQQYDAVVVGMDRTTDPGGHQDQRLWLYPGGVWGLGPAFHWGVGGGHWQSRGRAVLPAL